MRQGDRPDPPTARYVRDDRDTLVSAQDREATKLLRRDADEPTSISGVYAWGEVIGRGGMGEVVLAHDKRIGRDVAVKRLHADAPTEDEIARFLREARIQARLDHPAIVPVYELARDDRDRPYFTMKRLSGITLADMLRSPAPPRQRILRAFADICRAIDFAHSRGVVHRDLKPANVILGEFGEVYVLDWGVARVIDDDVATADTDALEGSAPPGRVLGTLGYIAPEQLRHPEIGRPADIYALGSILFEVLAGEFLHPVQPQQAGIDSTMSPDTVVSPAKRRPDRAVPPELDALCTAMLAMEPERRPTARRVADRIEAYLDGDRDMARRRALATDLVWAARAAYDDDRGADAMRAASRALALDPETPGAAEIVTTLMIEPPAATPVELERAITEADAVGISRHARAAIPGYLAVAGFLPIALANGVLRPGVLVAITVIALALAVWAFQIVRKPIRPLVEMIAYAATNALLVVMIGRLAGPFTFVPALMCFITMSIITYPTFLTRPGVLLGIMVGGFLVPIGLEALDLLSSTWELVPSGGMLAKSGAMEAGSPSSVLMVILASVVTIFMAGLQALRVSRASREAQHQLVRQAWHLAQLLPATPSGSMPFAASSSPSITRP